MASVRVVTWHKLTVRSRANRKSIIDDKAALFKPCGQNGNSNGKAARLADNITVSTMVCNDSETNGMMTMMMNT